MSIPHVSKTAALQRETISFPVMGVSFARCIMLEHSSDIIFIVFTSVSYITSQQPEGRRKEKEE